MAKTPLSNIRASIKYDKANTTRVAIKLNNHTDADVIEWLNKQENKQGYIKKLIRDDIKKSN